MYLYFICAGLHLNLNQLTLNLTSMQKQMFSITHFIYLFFLALTSQQVHICHTIMRKEDAIHPKDKANFVSRVTLWWIFELLWKGNSSPLEHDDLYSVKNEERAEHLTKCLQKKWEDEKRRAVASKRKPRFWKALLRFFTWKDYQFLVFTGLTRIISLNVAFFSIIKLIHFVGRDIYYGEPRDRCFIYIYGMAMGHLVQTICINHYHLRGAVMAIQARAATVGLLYRKVRQHLKMITIETTDAERSLPFHM